MQDSPESSITNSYEELYRGFEVYVAPDRDPYRGGFEWSVCKNETEYDAGLTFSIADAITAAREAVDELTL